MNKISQGEPKNTNCDRPASQTGGMRLDVEVCSGIEGAGVGGDAATEGSGGEHKKHQGLDLHGGD